mgnify:CR=1 FL=1
MAHETETPLTPENTRIPGSPFSPVGFLFFELGVMIANGLEFGDLGTVMFSYEVRAKGMENPETVAKLEQMERDREFREQMETTTELL